jgi:hypothetical protein
MICQYRNHYDKKIKGSKNTALYGRRFPVPCSNKLNLTLKIKYKGENQRRETIGSYKISFRDGGSNVALLSNYCCILKDNTGILCLPAPDFPGSSYFLGK